MSKAYLLDADGTLWKQNPIIPAFDRFAKLMEASSTTDADTLSRLLLYQQEKEIEEGNFVRAYDWDAIILDFLQHGLKFSKQDAQGKVKKFDELLDDALEHVELLEGVEEAI